MTPNDLLGMLQAPAASLDLYTYLRDHLIASFDLKPYQDNAAKYSKAELSEDVTAEIHALNYIVEALSTLTREVAKVDSDEEATHISQEYQKPIIDKILYGKLMPSMLREKLPNLAPPKSELASKPFLFSEASSSIADMPPGCSSVNIASGVSGLTELDQMRIFKNIKEAVQQGNRQIAVHHSTDSPVDALILAWSLYSNFNDIFSGDDIQAMAKKIVAKLNSLREQRPGLVQAPDELMSAIELAAQFKAFSLDVRFDEKFTQQLAAVKAAKELAVTNSLRNFGYKQCRSARPMFFGQEQEKPSVPRGTQPTQGQCCTIS